MIIPLFFSRNKLNLRMSLVYTTKQVPLPDLRGREKILKVHAKDVPLADPGDLRKIARGTLAASIALAASI